MHRYARVARQAVQEAPVGSGKAFARRTRCEQEFADGLAPVREGSDERVGGWLLARGRDDLEVVAVVRERDGGVGQLERLPDDPDDRGQHGLGGERYFETLAQARDHRVWVVAL